LAPDQSDYLVNLATVYQWEKKTDQALNIYKQGIRHNPKEPVYYLKMADLYLSQGEKEKALERLDKAWNLGPKNAKVLSQMGEDYQQAGQADMANRCQVKARSLTSNSGT
jgi:Tfp pilus assembly protein PilF